MKKKLKPKKSKTLSKDKKLALKAIQLVPTVLFAGYLANKIAKSEIVSSLVANKILKTNFEGKYKITKKLGEGGFGQVFQGYRISDNQEVVVKMVPVLPVFREGSHNLDPISLEITTKKEINNIEKLKTLKCNIIPSVLDLTYTKDYKRVIVYKKEFTENLHRYKGYRSNVIFKHNVILDLLEGLECLHRNGMVHGDIKPDNILADKDGNTQLIDYGLSCIKGVLGCGIPSFGTEIYNFNEVYNFKTTTNPFVKAYLVRKYSTFEHLLKADIYMLGTTFYELYNGKPLTTKEKDYILNNGFKETENKFYRFLNLMIGDKRVNNSTKILQWFKSNVKSSYDLFK